jgi:hypothetical protein
MSRLKAKPPPSANGRNGHANGHAGRHAPEPVPAGPKEGRDAKGRFAKGWRGGPGAPANPFNRRVAELRRALVEALGERGITRLVEALLRQVEKNGDLAAAEVLLTHALGKPVKACHPNRVDEDEFDSMAAAPDLRRLAAVGNRHVPWSFALATVRASLALMRCFAMGHPAESTGLVLGDLGWAKVLGELNDDELSEWFAQIQAEAERARQPGGQP